MQRWPEIERWSARRRGLESRRLPGALARATAPALWQLPAGVSLEDLRIAAGMLQGA